MNSNRVEETAALRDMASRALREQAAGLSPFTIATYRRILQLFCDWYAAHYGAEATRQALSDEVVARYLQWSAMRVSASTVRLRRSALRWMADALKNEEPGHDK